ncbi:MAG: hypothetical protein AAF514_10910, partial [Verrucomicrobiota bacterium]
MNLSPIYNPTLVILLILNLISSKLTAQVSLDLTRLPDGKLRLSWGPEAADYVLQQSINLVTWAEADVAIVGGDGFHADIIPDIPKFFRLIRNSGDPGPAAPPSGVISVNADGTATGNQGVLETGYRVSADGRYVAFISNATDLVSLTDTNNSGDLFLRDLQENVTTMITKNVRGDASVTHDDFGQATLLGLSDDGRFVLFASTGTDVTEDSPGIMGTYLHDQQSGMTTFLKGRTEGFDLNSGGSGSLSGDGQWIAFGGSGGYLFAYHTPTSDLSIVHDNDSGAGAANTPWISDDGRKVLFLSRSPNITPENDGNFDEDLFIHDRETGETSLVSINADGDGTGSAGVFRGGYAFSPDGRYVAFYSLADDLVPTGIDTNSGLDLFLRDTEQGTTILVTTNAEGTAATASDPASFVFSAPTPSFSGDGQRLVFQSFAADLNTGTSDTNQTF